MLGLHWIARATGCDPARLADAGLLADTLRALPDRLGLTRIGEPVVGVQEGGGIAGVVLLSESHASLHAVPSEGLLFADIFSCAPFTPEAAALVLGRAYAPAALEQRLVERGGTEVPDVAIPPAGTSRVHRRPDGQLVLLQSLDIDGHAVDFEVSAVLFDRRSEHQHVLVVDTPMLGRALFLDGVVQSAALDEADYHAALVRPALAAHPAPRRVLIAGGGEGATARDVLAWRARGGPVAGAGVEHVRMVEIDPVVVEAARTQLPTWSAGAFDDPRVEVVHADFFAVLDQERGWDVIVVDLVDEVVDWLVERDLAGRLARALAPGGVVVVQCGEVDPADPSEFAGAVEALRGVFPEAAPYQRWMQSFGASWGFVVSRAPAGGALPEWEGLAWLPAPVRVAIAALPDAPDAPLDDGEEAD